MNYVKRLPQCTASQWTGSYESKQEIFKVARWDGDPPAGYRVHNDGAIEFSVRGGDGIHIPIDHVLVATQSLEYRPKIKYTVMSHAEFFQEWEEDMRGQS